MTAPVICAHGRTKANCELEDLNAVLATRRVPQDVTVTYDHDPGNPELVAAVAQVVVPSSLKRVG